MFRTYLVYEGPYKRAEIAIREDADIKDLIKEIKLSRVIKKSDRFKDYQVLPGQNSNDLILKYKNEPRFRLERK